MRRARLTPEGELVFDYKRRGSVWTPAGLWRGRLWRTIVEWAAVSTVVCVILAIGGLVGLYAARPQLDAASRAFAGASIDAIVPAWNQDELFARTASDFLPAGSRQYGAYFGELKRLGPGARDKGCIGSAAINPLSNGGAITASYVCELDLKSGTGVVTLALRQEAGAWKITKFYVSAAR